MQLRESFHDRVKTSLGSTYNEHFGKTPFAHMGAPRGTTARLSSWCGALATCVNSLACQPELVHSLLKSLEVPPPPSLVGSASSNVMGKMKDKWSSAKDSAKERFEQTQITVAQTAQSAALSAAKTNPKAAKVASGAGLSFMQQNPKVAQTAAASAGGVGWKALRSNPKMAIGAAKLAAKANFSK
jgi:hypothetical protein